MQAGNIHKLAYSTWPDHTDVEEVSKDTESVSCSLHSSAEPDHGLLLHLEFAGFQASTEQRRAAVTLHELLLLSAA